ncbi:putative cytochrome P450 oxidoreductase [Aspergillus indologenus CBS 114.80]|uniref:Putative cytochrome P450 oxidoreductase n=1 Tax=Aspergillus indologenus CBS 114.80 TaxID=1450541 RepID=A0A2V5IC18_9EURO|nr:putative cytochrome P450 oxidoreductase [Aspergillus indologenus CBS 114.80]
MSREQLVWAQAIFTAIAVFLWWAYDPNSWSNRILSYVIDKYLRWRYPVKSVHGRSQIPTRPYKFPDGGGSTKFLDGETVSGDWEKKYGPIYRIWTGLVPEIVLTRPDDVKTVYKDSDKHFKVNSANAGWVLGTLLGDGVGLLNGSDWKRVHTVVAPPFGQKATAYVDLVSSRVQRHFAEFEDRCVKQGRTTPLQLQATEDLSSFPFWVLKDIIYGELPDAMNQELTELIDLRNEIWSHTFKGGWSMFSFNKLFYPTLRRQLHEFEHRWEAFNDEVYAHILAQGTTSLPIVALHRAINEGRVKRSEVLHSISEGLFTNVDVTMGTFAWLALLLALHPEIQTELREEIAQARAQGTPEAWEQYIASHTTLLAGCVVENGRLRPIANYTYPQYLPEDRAVAGYVVPRGTYFIVDTNALNRRDPAWGADGDEFRPHRYMEASVTEYRYRLWRFGFGPRQCLAQALADTMMKCLVVHLIERYRIAVPEALAGGKEDWKTRRPDTWFSMAQNPVVCERI